MFNIELLADAENEMAEAYDWYEERQAKLGDRFYHEVGHYLTLIEKNPYHFPIKYPQEMRSAALDTFPFVIIYWIDELSYIAYVVSIFHTSRKPKY